MRLRRFKRRLALDEAVSLTSLMDVMTILLVFLLATMGDVTPGSSDPKLSLPLSSSLRPVHGALELVVGPRGIQLGKRKILDAEATAAAEEPWYGVSLDDALLLALREALALERAANPSSRTILLQADRAVPYSVLESLMGESRRAGFEHFQFLLIQTARP